MILGKKIAEGNTAEIYEYGKDRICKLFRINYPEEAIRQEFNNASVLYEKTHRAPKCFAVITYGERIGLIFERLFGHDLLQEMLEHLSDPERLLGTLAEMAELQKTLLQCRLENGISYKTFFTEFDFACL